MPGLNIIIDVAEVDKPGTRARTNEYTDSDSLTDGYVVKKRTIYSLPPSVQAPPQNSLQTTGLAAYYYSVTYMQLLLVYYHRFSI